MHKFCVGHVNFKITDSTSDVGPLEQLMAPCPAILGLGSITSIVGYLIYVTTPMATR